MFSWVGGILSRGLWSFELKDRLNKKSRGGEGVHLYSIYLVFFPRVNPIARGVWIVDRGFKTRSPKVYSNRG